jgi:hypothetical protein
MNESSTDSNASILDLERRVRLLEQGLYGHTAPQAGAVLLTRCYLEAHRLLKHLDPENVAVWVAQAYLWDVRALVTLGRHVNDPYPFRPFLAVLDLCVLQSVPGAEEALRHLESVSQDLLTAQGLELVRPRDTMGRLRLSEAIAHLRSR